MSGTVVADHRNAAREESRGTLEDGDAAWMPLDSDDIDWLKEHGGVWLPAAQRVAQLRGLDGEGATF